MWRTVVVGLGLVVAATALAQTTSQPRTNTPTVNPQAPSVNAPTVSPPSAGGGAPTVNTPTVNPHPPAVGTPTARPSMPTTPTPTVNVVDCGNGSVCPAGNACLEDGMCGPLIDQSSVPGAVRTSSGGWCFPGFHENRFFPGQCTHNSRTECPGGLSCGPGRTCDGKGGCIGGVASGPICDPADPRPCEDSSFSCGSGGRCIPSYNQECRSGRICDRNAACGMTGCVVVSAARTPQVPRRR